MSHQSETIAITVQKKYDSWRNQLRFTPSPKNKTLIEAMNKGQEPIAETINYILHDYFNKMPEQQRRQLIATGKNHY